jgi:hypothetical protein
MLVSIAPNPARRVSSGNPFSKAIWPFGTDRQAPGVAGEYSGMEVIDIMGKEQIYPIYQHFSIV